MVEHWTPNYLCKHKLGLMLTWSKSAQIQQDFLNLHQLENYPRPSLTVPEQSHLTRQKSHRHICFLPSILQPPHPLLSAVCSMVWLTLKAEDILSLCLLDYSSRGRLFWGVSGGLLGGELKSFIFISIVGRWYCSNNGSKLFISCVYFTFLKSVKGATHGEGLPFNVA